MSKQLLILALIFSAFCVKGQPVSILFKVGSQLDTEMTGASDVYFETRNGPYRYYDIDQLIFMQTLPDSAVVQDILSRGVKVFHKNKPVKPVTRSLPPKAPDTAKGDISPRTETTETTPSTENADEPEITGSVGVGLGLDYGGIVGLRLTAFSTSVVSIFGAVGYNLAEVGLNGGLDLNFTPRKRSTAFLCMMYGYNGVIIGPSSSKTYYGPSFGLGGKWRLRNDKYFTGQLIYPVRDKEFDQQASSADGPVFPVLISFGFNF